MHRRIRQTLCRKLHWENRLFSKFVVKRDLWWAKGLFPPGGLSCLLPHQVLQQRITLLRFQDPSGGLCFQPTKLRVFGGWGVLLPAHGQERQGKRPTGVTPTCWLVAVIQLLGPVQLFATPWAAARQASLPFTISQSLLKLMSVESVMPSNQQSWKSPSHAQGRDDQLPAALHLLLSSAVVACF